MDKLLGLLAVGASFLSGYTTTMAFEEHGSDSQLILGAVFGLCTIVCLIGVAILERMNTEII